MKYNIAFIGYGYPEKETNGAPMVTYCLLKSFVEKGFNVTFFALVDSQYDHDYNRGKSLLDAINVKLIEINIEKNIEKKFSIIKKIKHLFMPMELYFPSVNATQEIKKQIEGNSYNLIFTYHFEGLAAIYDNFPKIPKYMIMGDPVHLSHYYFWKRFEFKISLKYLFETFKMIHAYFLIPYIMKKMLKNCDYVGQLAAHYMDLLKNKMKLNNCEHLRMPILDDAGKDCFQKRNELNKNKKKFKIIMIGAIFSSSTYSGFKMLYEEILPLMEKKIGLDEVEIHIIGKGQENISEEVCNILKKYPVKLRGYVDSASYDFFTADVLLIATPISLGVRTRAIVGFSYGCPIVAHSFNSLGLPEMINNKNALLADNAKDIVESIKRLKSDKNIAQTISKNARKTYEDYFLAEKVIEGIILKVNELIRNKKG